MVYPIMKYIAWPIFSLFIKKIEGLENLPDKPCIMVSNHQSYLDGPLLFMMVAWHKNRKVYTFATNDRFLGPFWNMLFEHYGAIRVNGSIKKAMKKIRQKKQLLLFPEGQRAHTEKMQKIEHKGMGVLALNTKVPVVPIGINTYHFWNRNQLFPSFKRNIGIVIGKPIKFKEKAAESNYLKVTKKAMKEVKKLARRAHAITTAKIKL